MYCVSRINKIFKNVLVNVRVMSIQASTKDNGKDFEEIASSKDQVDWLNAKPYKEIPGPSMGQFILSSLPGGKLYGKNLLDMNHIFYNEYGSIFKIPGNFGYQDIIFTFNPDDFEKVYRTEGIWPIRKGFDTFAYYRKDVRPDIFKGIGGLTTDQGESWGKMRSIANPVLMKPQTMKHHLPDIDAVAVDFVKKISEIRDPVTYVIPKHFAEEVNKWAFESVCTVALNTRLGLIAPKEPAHDILKLVTAIKQFFQLSFEFDVLPSLWRYYKTPKFKKLMATYDDITEIITKYIDVALKRADTKEYNDNSIGVLDQLLKIDRQVAIVLAIDMMMAGIDTTSSTFIGLLYRLATNPDKQEKLRKEIYSILPDKDAPLTKDNTKNMPYLRACLKESLRFIPITPGNIRNTGQDLVLSNYQIPKGTSVLMCFMKLANSDQYFSKSNEFLPERWLKHSQEEDCPHLKSNHPFVYLPFGFGSRACVGRRLAEMEIETLISRIIRNYRVSWDSPNSMQFTCNVVIAPTNQPIFKSIINDILN